MRVGRSASLEKERPLAESFSSRKASIGLRARDGFETLGTSGLRIGWKDQNARSLSVIHTAGTSSGSGRMVFAPASIHAVIVAISLSESLFLPLGISRAVIFLQRRLSAGLPGMMAAPDLPPVTTKRRRRRSRLAFLVPSSP